MLDEIKTAILNHMQGFQDEMDRPLNFWNLRFGQSFFVLTFCRMLHSLHTGTVPSKKTGAQWTKSFIDPKWANLIERAWREREGVRFGVKIRQRAEQAILQETLDFMNYAIAQIDKYEIRTG